MLERFMGTGGERYLVEALKNHTLIEHDEALAKRIAEKGILSEFKLGEVILTEGAADNDVCFIIVGQADVLVKGRHVAVRGTRDSIGEMAILDPTATRSATVKAITDGVLLRVIEPDFQQIANDFPSIWRILAQVTADRLRQRAALLNQPNGMPVLFLGCSAESLDIAREIQAGLMHDNIDVIVWTDGVFGASTVTIDALLQSAQRADFAAFVFSPDDKVVSRHKQDDAPRDNTVFELGLFMGRLDRSRTFIIKDARDDVKIPTDLLGITPISYVHKSEWKSTLGPVCQELRTAIDGLGPR